MLALTGTAAQIDTIATAADTLAHRIRGEERGAAADGSTIEQARVDALAALCEQALADPHLKPSAKARRVADVVIDLATLLGLADSPGYLPGHGYIPADLARELAADARWRRLVNDPATGHLLDYGTTVYTPPAALAAYVRAARTCRAPGCDRRSEICDLDHRDPFPRHPDGTPATTSACGPCSGCTSAHNLDPECRWHHLLKTHHGFRVAPGPAPGPSRGPPRQGVPT